MIEYAVRRLLEELTPQLEELLAPDAMLVPMPKNAPFPPRATNVLWVPQRICSVLKSVGLGGRVLTCLERIEAVQKSAYAAAGGRPSARRHYETTRARREVAPPNRVVVIDDVITKGNTVAAGVSRICEVMPDADVRAFALVRTCGLVPEVEQIVEPVVGTVTVNRWGEANRLP